MTFVRVSVRRGNTMLKRVLSLLLLAVLGLSGCASALPDQATPDFLTVYPQGSLNNAFWIGDSKANIRAIMGYSSVYCEVWYKYDENDLCTSMLIESASIVTMYGTSLNSNYKDLIPAYTSKDPDIQVDLDTRQKVIFSKEIDGVKYTVTYRNYPNGDVKTITITNTGKYTEDAADYEADYK